MSNSAMSKLIISTIGTCTRKNLWVQHYFPLLARSIVTSQKKAPRTTSLGLTRPSILEACRGKSRLVTCRTFSTSATRHIADPSSNTATIQGSPSSYKTPRPSPTTAPQNTTAAPLPPSPSEQDLAPQHPYKAPPPTLLSSLPSLPHENIYTLPNFLTFSRLICAPAIGYLILHDSHVWATGLFFYAGVTDLVDGWIARRWNQQTVVGSIIDPLADKALMTILTVCLAVKGALPVWLATLILGRDVSLAIAAIYYRYASLPLPKTFLRYWDFSLPSAEVHPTAISKYNTLLQLLLIGATTVLPVIGSTMNSFLHLSTGVLSGLTTDVIMKDAQLLVAGTTIWSGLSYLYARGAVKILGSGTEAEKKGILRNGRFVILGSFVGCGVVAWALESRFA